MSFLTFMGYVLFKGAFTLFVAYSKWLQDTHCAHTHVYTHIHAHMYMLAHTQTCTQYSRSGAKYIGLMLCISLVVKIDFLIAGHTNTLSKQSS